LASWSVAVPCRWQQRLQHRWVHRRPVGCDLDWPDSCGADGLLKEPTGGVSVSSGGEEHVDHLAELVDRPIHITPAPGDLHIGLVDLPAVTKGMSAGPGSLAEQAGEAKHPVDGDVVDLDTAFDQEFFDVAVRQAEAEIPADRDDDHVGWETEAGEGGSRDWREGEGGGFSSRQSRRSHAGAANATVPYDVIPRVQASGLDELGRMIVFRIQVLDGVTRTLTCMVLHR
jgi:hypothetical protein